jgi:hypothetical protein
MKVETIEEFKARGGKITVLPPQESPMPTHTVGMKDHFDLGALSLGHVTMADLPEKSTSGKTTSSLKTMLQNSWLPAEIKNRIMEHLDEINSNT